MRLSSQGSKHQGFAHRHAAVEVSRISNKRPAESSATVPAHSGTLGPGPQYARVAPGWFDPGVLTTSDTTLEILWPSPHDKACSSAMWYRGKCPWLWRHWA